MLKVMFKTLQKQLGRGFHHRMLLSLPLKANLLNFYLDSLQLGIAIISIIVFTIFSKKVECFFLRKKNTITETITVDPCHFCYQ